MFHLKTHTSRQKYSQIMMFLMRIVYIHIILSLLVERSDVTCDTVITNIDVRPDSKNDRVCLCRSRKSQQKYTLACFIVLCLAVTWVASTQLCQQTYIPNQFHSPLLCMYFWTAWLILFYPIYIAIELIVSKGNFPVGQSLR